MNAKALNIKSNHRHNCKVIGLKDIKHVRYFFKSIPLGFLNEAYMIIVFSKVGGRHPYMAKLYKCNTCYYKLLRICKRQNFSTPIGFGTR